MISAHEFETMSAARVDDRGLRRHQVVVKTRVGAHVEDVGVWRVPVRGLDVERLLAGPFGR
jgi:hypothetical protein